MNPANPATAFGAPGIEPRWTASTKEGIGTAYHTSSRVWFTFSRLSELTSIPVYVTTKRVPPRAPQPIDKPTIWERVLDVLDDAQDLVPRQNIRYSSSLATNLGLEGLARGAIANRLNKKFSQQRMKFRATETAACATAGEIYTLSVSKARDSGALAS